MNIDNFDIEVLRLYPYYDKVLGPYLRKDGRKHIILYKSKLPKRHNRKRRTISYPKLLVEITLGRRLTDDETVDHINGDFTDDNLINLRVLPRREHVSLDVIRYKPTSKPCVRCGKLCQLSSKQISRLVSNMKRGKIGPFCGRRCSGLYGQTIQSNPDTIKPKKVYRFTKGKLKNF